MLSSCKAVDCWDQSAVDRLERGLMRMEELERKVIRKTDVSKFPRVSIIPGAQNFRERGCTVFRVETIIMTDAARSSLADAMLYSAASSDDTYMNCSSSSCK
eukprot:scaffold10013_cov79-Skeletonema_dohrnii-CCMP3373.AAC.3